MTVITSGRFADWSRGAGLLGLALVAWAVLVPGGAFWNAVLAVGLIGVGLATAALVRTRQTPSLAQVIARAEAEPEGARGRKAQRP